jgi:hypothetical protein
MADCGHEHWEGQAAIYDDGTLLRPAAFRSRYPPAPHLDLDLLDRTRYREPVFRAGRRIPGGLAIQFWGHDRDRVLAATRQRFDAELRRGRRRSRPGRGG